MAVTNPSVDRAPGTSGPNRGEVLAFADLRLDPLGQTLVTAAGEDIPLTGGEFRLLLAFAQAPGRVLSRDQLLDCVSGRRSEPFDRSIDVLVGRLRRKIERDPKIPELIVTIPGFGYKFTVNPLPTVVENNTVSVREAPATTALAAAAGPAPRRNQLLIRIGAATAIGGFVAITLLLLSQRLPSIPAPRTNEAKNAALLPPDKPSIAVLPFTNIGGDAKQERLADGTEDLISDLSRYHSLFVIARNSVMTYKGKPVNVQQVGRELGVRFVMEGSIQTNGDRVRVTVQLIDAATDAHVWSDRYDRPLNDIFEVQSEVTQQITGTLGGLTGTLAEVDAASIRRKPPANLTAYDYYVEGQELHYRITKDDVAKGEVLLKKAIELDPQFARAYYGLGHVYLTQAIWGLSDTDPTALFERSRDTLLKAIALDPNDAIAYAALSVVYGEL